MASKWRNWLANMYVNMPNEKLQICVSYDIMIRPSKQVLGSNASTSEWGKVRPRGRLSHRAGSHRVSTGAPKNIWNIQELDRYIR